MLSMNKIANIVVVILIAMMFMSLLINIFGGSSGNIFVPENPSNINQITLNESSLIL